MDKFERNFFVLWALGAVLTVAFWIGVIWVAFHFLAKVW